MSERDDYADKDVPLWLPPSWVLLVLYVTAILLMGLGLLAINLGVIRRH
jgi:hypothetical protein